MSRAKLKSLEDQESIELDVVIEERPEFNTEVSDHPIEDGASVSDHVALRPVTIPMNGVVAGEGAAEKIAALRRWRNERHRLRYTGRNIFKNYVISELSSEHDAEVGDGFRFRRVLQEVRIVKPALVEIVKPDPVEEDPEVEESPAGTQATATQTKETEDKGRQQPVDTGQPSLDEEPEPGIEVEADPLAEYKTVLEDQKYDYTGHPARG